MTNSESTPPTDDAGGFSVSRGQLIYATTLLALVSMFNYLDRHALSILVEPIKHEFGFSDTQMGLLTGFAFSLTYAIFGIPLARMADSRNRVRLLSACIAVWSLATVLAGAVTSFGQMVIARVVVGIGEAGGNPASVSIIGDYYRPEMRARGLSFFNLGAVVGTTVGLALVGFIADRFGWRVAFFTMGVPGLVLATLILTTLREPVRGRFQDSSIAYDTDTGWWQGVQQVLSSWTVRHLLLAYGITSFGGHGVGAWFGAFFMRVHDLSLTEVGAVLGIILGLGGLVGTLLGAVFVPMLVRRDRRWEVWWPGFAYVVIVPVYAFVFYSDNIVHVYVALMVTSLVSASCLGAILSAMQSVVPAHLRALGMAMIMFAVSFIGTGSGPLFIGWASDFLAPQFGANSLRYALVIGVLVMGWGTAHFFLAARHLRRDLIS